MVVFFDHTQVEFLPLKSKITERTNAEMLEWVARNWQTQWLGNFAWWQAVAALAQVFFAGALLVVTKRYVRLTRDLVDAQIVQIRLNQQATKRELYERRLKVFLATMDFLATFAIHLKAEFADAHKLLRETLEAEFLFDKDVADFIDELRRKALEHRGMTMASGDPREAHRREQLLDQAHKLEEWLAVTAFAEAKAKFHPYLRLSETELDTLLKRAPGATN